MKLARSFLYICNTKYPKLGTPELHQSRLLRENSSLARGIKQYLNKQQRPRYEFITQWIKSQFLFKGGTSPLIQSPSTKIPEHQVHLGRGKRQSEAQPVLRALLTEGDTHTPTSEEKAQSLTFSYTHLGFTWRLTNLQRVCLRKTFLIHFLKCAKLHRYSMLYSNNSLRA